MKPWQDAVQAQLFFTQKLARQLSVLNESGGSVADYKMCASSLLLSSQALWCAWLNEWAEYLNPKQKIQPIADWDVFLQRYNDREEVLELSSTAKQEDAWLTCMLETEKLNPLTLNDVVNEWGAGFLESKRETPLELSDDAAIHALSIKHIEIRSLSVSKGPEDLSVATNGLRELIKKVRDRHSEY